MAESVFAPAQELFDLWFETNKGAFSRFWETPAVGPARERTEKMMQGFSTFAELYSTWMSSSVELQAVSQESMRRTQEKIAAGLVGDLRPDSYKDFYKIWMDVYSETFDEFLKSGDFAADLGEFTSRSMEFQRFSREMVEENYLKPMNLPTKSEIDEVNKEVYALKKVVKEASKAAIQRQADIDELRAEVKETKKALRALEKAAEKAGSQTVDLPSRKEIDGIKRELDSLKGTSKGSTKKVKKVSEKK